MNEQTSEWKLRKTKTNENKDANGKKSLILPLILRKGVNVCRWGKKTEIGAIEKGAHRIYLSALIDGIGSVLALRSNKTIKKE